jgi:PAS domain-containing protein
VSPEINQGIRDAIARAVKGEFVRWDTPLYASPDRSITIIIDASVMPVKDDQGEVVFLACEGRDITEKKAQEREIVQKNLELQGLLERIRELDEILDIGLPVMEGYDLSTALRRLPVRRNLARLAGIKGSHQWL